MKRPNVFCYLVGNPLSMFAILIGSGFLVYQWWIGLLNGVAPVLAVFAIGTTMNASQKVAEYGSWKRSWNAMGGVSRGARWGWLRIPVGVLAWVLGAVAISKLDPHQPMTRFAVLSFVLATLLIVVVMLYRLWRRWAARHPRQRKVVLVTISLRVPRQSPGPKQFYKGVPAYCARLSSWKETPVGFMPSGSAEPVAN